MSFREDRVAATRWGRGRSGDGLTYYGLGQGRFDVETDYDDRTYIKSPPYSPSGLGMALALGRYGGWTGTTGPSGGAPRLSGAASALSDTTQSVINSQGDVRGLGLGLIGNNYAGEVANIGTRMFGVGGDILGMNPNAGGIAGEYIAALNAIDPDRYVSGAAEDVSSSFDTSKGAMERELSRAGISANSGRSKAMQQQYAQALAAALAGAKTRARQTGMAERLAALTNATTIGGNLASSGAGLLTNAGLLNNATASTAAGIIGQADTTELNAAQMAFTGQNAVAALEQNDEQFYASLGQQNMQMWLNYFKK